MEQSNTPLLNQPERPTSDDSSILPVLFDGQEDQVRDPGPQVHEGPEGRDSPHESRDLSILNIRDPLFGEGPYQPSPSVDLRRRGEKHGQLRF
jgi:hypothetical protein